MFINVFIINPKSADSLDNFAINSFETLYSLRILKEGDLTTEILTKLNKAPKSLKKIVSSQIGYAKIDEYDEANNKFI